MADNLAIPSTSPSDLAPSAPTPEAESQLAFIQEIRSDRLAILWKATFVAVLGLAWLILIFAADNGSSLINLFIPVIVIAVASYSTQLLLKRQRYNDATWVYTLGLVVTISIMLINDNEDTRNLVPNLGILVIFIIGMLMSVRNTFILLVTSYVLMVGMPFVITGELPITEGGIFAFLLMALSALLVTQVSGELYSIAQWAIDSYRKERETANKLHDSRLEVERSLLKQKNLTLQLQTINVQLDEAREAAELAKQFRGQFLANMSHELRTPLNAIIGFSETMLNFPMMYNNTSLPDDYRNDLERIFNSGKHLLRIINDILDISKIDVGRLEIEIQPVELGPVFDSLLETAQGLISGKPIKLISTVPSHLPQVLGDPLRVRQVLINLYSNAAKFTDEGSITLSLESTDEDVTISVTDTGPGIETEYLDRIFEAFQQGSSGRKLKRQGSGLGLAISKQLLELMNGSIGVESEYGKGARFWVKLPRYKPTTEEEWVEVKAEK